ncbi:hypothetical protein ACJJTC_017848 [Scirpophaga incertulas]
MVQGKITPTGCWLGPLRWLLRKSCSCWTEPVCLPMGVALSPASFENTRKKNRRIVPFKLLSMGWARRACAVVAISIGAAIGNADISHDFKCLCGTYGGTDSGSTYSGSGVNNSGSFGIGDSCRDDRGANVGGVIGSGNGGSGSINSGGRGGDNDVGGL